MAKKQKGISPDGTELLDFSSNPFPTYYRHQDGDKQIKMRGHVDQDDTEITIVLPRVSGSLAIIGDGGSIDLSDYYTKGEVESLINDLDVEIKNDYYDKTEIDKLLADFGSDSDGLQAQLDALEVLIAKNSDDISKNAMDISLNSTAISDNADDIKENTALITTNKDNIAKNTKDISDLKAQVNAGKDKASQYVWKEPTNYEDNPDEGDFYAGNGVVFVDEIKLTEYIYMSKIDDDVVTHNLDAIEKGDVIEADLGGDNPAHGVFEVDSVEMIGDTHAKIKVIPIRTAGNWSDQNRTSDVDSWSMSFMLGLEVEASNYYSKTETDNLFTSKTDFEDHEKKNDEDIKKNQDAIKENSTRIDDKASLSAENIFNGKQTFNKNLTVKGAETSIIPTFNSRWHKFSVNPPKNEDGSNNTSEAYGVNYWLDAGNTWKNQFRISNRNGVAFEVRGGSDLNGQLHSQWTYSGPQTDDNNIATVKYVKDAVEGINIPDVDLTGYATEDYVQEEINKIDIPETDLSDYMTEDETVEFVDTMDKLTLANAKLDAGEQDRNYAVPLAGNSTKTGKLVLKTNEGTPFEIQSGNGTPIFKMWSSGAVSMLKDYSEFKDNELVTKSYVDNGTVAISGAQTRTSGILTLQESSGKVFQVKKDNDITAELWADGTFITTRTDFSNNHLVSKAYVDDKVGSGGGSGFTQGDRVCATSAGATDVGGFYIENGNLYCKVN